MSIVLPKFDFSKASLKTTDELNKALEEAGTLKSRNFRPGQYDVVIKEVEYQGPAKDPNWGKLLLTLEGLGERVITAQIFLPLADIYYTTKKGERTLFMFQKFVKFMAAIGVQVTLETLQDVLTKYFSNPQRTLKNQKLTVNIGYPGNHIKYEGKDSAGQVKYSIAYKSGDMVKDDNGNTLIFPDWNAAKQEADNRQIEISEFTEVLAYLEAKTATVKVASNW